ncbi:MAG: biotin/lipoyl-binding protein [Defluviitaleaceae bacterium]|nr:biotin/lipoyl-binding protein [Defluviitaleaceae bacterium]
MSINKYICGRSNGRINGHIGGHIGGRPDAAPTVRILRICAVCAVAVVIAAGCGNASGGGNGQADLISADAVQSQSANYKTAVCDYGTLDSGAVTAGTMINPYKRKVFYEGDDATLTRMNVKNGDLVKQGDVLAVLGYDDDTLNLQKRQLQIQIDALTGDIQAEKERQAAAIEDARAQKDKMLSAAKTDGTDPAVAGAEGRIDDLNVRKMQENLDYYTYTSDAQLKAMNGQLDGINAKIAGVEILAPIGGRVIDVASLNPGASVADGTLLASVASVDIYTLLAANDTLNFRYNMPLEVNVTMKDGSVKNLEGNVVSDTSPFFINAGGTAGDFTDNVKSISISGSAYDLGTVLLVPNAAIFTEDNKTYVNVVEDGMAKKRYVQTGFSDRNNTQIITGLDAGQVVMVKQ